MNKTTEALKLADEAAEFARNICLGMNWSTDLPDEALAAIREARAEQEKQEPVGEVDLHKELGQMRWMGGDEGWDNAIHAVRNRLEELYAAPVSTEAIRAEALEEAAKVCESMIGTYLSHERCASAIRNLK